MDDDRNDIAGMLRQQYGIRRSDGGNSRRRLPTSAYIARAISSDQRIYRDADTFST